jgi:hypothetical protein
LIDSCVRMINIPGMHMKQIKNDICWWIFFVKFAEEMPLKM